MLDYKKEGCLPLHQFTIYLTSARNLSKHTVEHYFRDIRLFLQYYLQEVKKLPPPESAEGSLHCCDLPLLRQVTVLEIFGFLQWQAEEKQVGEKTRARRIASLKAFYRYLQEQDATMPNPVNQVPTPKLKKKLPVFLQDQEVENLLSQLCSGNYFRDYAIFMVILTGGLRVSEVVALNLEDFRQDSLLVNGKGGKQRVVYLSPPGVLALEEYLELRREIQGKPGHEEALFLSSQRNQRMAIITVQKMIQKTFQLGGFQGRGLSAHKLRHTAATHWLKEGVNLRVIQEILGHESLATTQIYTHVQSEELKRAALQSKFGVRNE